tara:strand:+ start:428 stop:553 length:126 start_codon:yes stop_codon:yes gene_type:complete
MILFLPYLYAGLFAYTPGNTLISTIFAVVVIAVIIMFFVRK